MRKKAQAKGVSLGSCLVLFLFAFTAQVIVLTANREQLIALQSETDGIINSLPEPDPELYWRSNRVAQPLKDGDAAVVSTIRQVNPRQLMEGNGCAVSSSGLVLTVAHTQGDVGSTASVWGNTPNRRGYRAAYRVIWRDNRRDMALLMPDVPLTSTITWQSQIVKHNSLNHGDAVSVLTIGDLDLHDVITSASCRNWHYWAGFQRNSHVTIQSPPYATLQFASGPGASGSPVYDSAGRLCGLVIRNTPQAFPLSFGTVVSRLDVWDFQRLLRDAETTAAATWRHLPLQTLHQQSEGT